MTKPKLGIALGSGGARGWVHVGVLQALKKHGLEPDIICGCSMGALVGAAYVSGELDSLETWALSIGRLDMLRYLDINILNGGVIDGESIMSILQNFKKDALIENLDKPFTAIATDLLTGREIWLQDGSLSEAIRASISIPGIFSPQKTRGKWLLDGGLTNPVPVSACRALGAEIIIAVNPTAGVLEYRYRDLETPEEINENENENENEPRSALLDRLFDTVPDRIKSGVKAMTPDFLNSDIDRISYFDVLSSSIDIVTSQIMRSRLAGEPPHILLQPRLGRFGTLDFHRAEEAITEGRKIVQDALPALRKLMA